MSNQIEQPVNPIAKFGEEVIDRLRNATNQLELDKAKAIAAHFQWCAEMANK